MGKEANPRHRKYFKRRLSFKTRKCVRVGVSGFLTPRDLQLFACIFDGPQRDRFDINKQAYTHRQALCVVKKTIVYLLMVLDNLAVYVKLKAGVQLGTAIDPRTSKANEQVVRRKIRDRRLKHAQYQIDYGLLGLSVEALIQKVRIGHMLLFVRLTQLNFNVGRV